jgi:hypothetical protein
MKSPAILFCVLVVLRAAPAAIPLIVVPNNLENTEGNSGSYMPFHIGNNSMRFQQVFDASQFSSFGSDTWRIGAVSFRVDSTPGGGGGPFTSTLTNIQLSLSTTTLGPDSLSPVFAQNIGSDEKIVFGPRSVSLSSGFSPMSAPQLFEIHFFFNDRPFIYNPTNGNLLLDVRNFAGGLTTFFDAVDVTNDVTSSVWALSANALTGMIDTKGLVVQFEANPIPEPGTLALTALGTIAGFIFFRSRQMNRK